MKKFLLYLVLILSSLDIMANEDIIWVDDNRLYYFQNNVYYYIDMEYGASMIYMVEPAVEGVFTIPSSIKFESTDYPLIQIDDYAFDYCVNITNIIIPESVGYIGKGAFRGCKKITEILIPKSVYEFGDFPFAACSMLKTINVDPNNDTFISDNGILYTKNYQTLVVYPEGKPETSFETPSQVKEIGRYAITNINLKKLKLGDSVESLELWSFAGCNYLIEVTLSPRLKNIGSRAFSACWSLESIEIPASVENIGEGAFAGCTSLKRIDVDKNNNFYCDVKGILYDKNQQTLIECPGGYIGSVEIPNSVNSILEEAFFACESITSVQLPPTLTEIKSNTFKQCYNLMNIEIPNHVKSIGSSAFNWCQNLSSVTLGNELEYIGESAFSCCPNLKIMYSYNSLPPECEGNPFQDQVYDEVYPQYKTNIETAVLHVPENHASQYKDAFPWQLFGTIIDDLPYKGTEDDGIDEIFCDNGLISPTNIYNIQGIIVKENATDLSGLGRGLYIVNGKKIWKNKQN